MKIVCAPDSFKGSINSIDAARAMADGIRAVLPDAEVDCCPIGDGGEGTLAALVAAIGGNTERTRAHGSHGEEIDAPLGRFDRQGFTYIESAAVIGLGGADDIMSASTRGVGELMVSAARKWPDRILIGIGGSATNDGGCGMAQALGVQFFDSAGRLISEPLAGGALHRIARIDMADRAGDIDNVHLVVVCDVSNPLTGPDGAAHVYGPQKGASPSQVAALDDGLKNLAALIRRDIGFDVDPVPGAGAAGGLGAGLLAFAGAEIRSGIQTILDVVDFESRLEGATLCLTGEGRIDAQSVSGKACVGVAGVASRQGVPTVALVGAAGPGADKCLAAGIERYTVIGRGLPAEESIRRAGELIAAAAAEVARSYQQA